MSEFRGAPASNAGDDYHELWATRHALRLLSEEDGLQSMTVEGVATSDNLTADKSAWDGVDCALFFGGRSAKEAARIDIEQLKYSAANPTAPWTVARLIAGTSRDKSVIAKLAKAWKAMKDLHTASSLIIPNSVLVSNQPVAAEVIAAFAIAKTKSIPAAKRKPADKASPAEKLAYASCLTPDEFQAFAQTIRFECGAGSRFAIEEKLLSAVAAWSDHDIAYMARKIREFVHQRMLPEQRKEPITRESILVSCLGVSDATVVFPCPSEIKLTSKPVSRAKAREAATRLRAGVQYLCLHGMGGVGKTTALQEIESGLPPASIMIKFDCYGGGRYLDPSALRHRPMDAFLQLTNQLATQLKLPLLLSRQPTADYPKLFANRLKHAASALMAQDPAALIVIAVDAADNATTAAASRIPAETCFVHDFVQLSALPENVRFVISSRTGRLESLRLPQNYQCLEIEPFSLLETQENVHRIWPASDAWIADFHHFSGGVPRVQSYAFETMPGKPEHALESLRPSGKSLAEVFRQQFDLALRKGGDQNEVIRLCAGLIALPRPVPIPDLASVLAWQEARIIDTCTDLAPGVRIQNNAISFADEDFEAFVRTEGITQFDAMQQAVASRLLAHAKDDPYAALHVAAALVAAKRGAELLELVEREPAPLVIGDPVLRREAEVSRLRLAINVCRAAGDVPKALRFVLIGVEGIKTEAAIKDLLIENPDLAAAFANETAGRLILADSNQIAHHGRLLFHKLSADANHGDAIAVREGKRLLNAWFQARHDHYQANKNQHNQWEFRAADITSWVEANLKLDGPAAAIDALQRQRDKEQEIEVAITLPMRMIAEGRADAIDTAAQMLNPIGKLLLSIALALAGHNVDIKVLEIGLAKLWRCKLKVTEFSPYAESNRLHWHTLDTALTACELLAWHGTASTLVEKVLASFLTPELLKIEKRHQHEAELLNFIFRAFALRETLAGRVPSAKNIFRQRPKPRQKAKTSQHDEESDRRLMELSNAVFGIYVAVAAALVNQQNQNALERSLQSAVGNLKAEEWRISRQTGTADMRALAAQTVTVLLAAGYIPHTIKQYSCQIPPNWPRGHATQNELLFARLCLRHELHEPLLQDISQAAEAALTMRVGASEKTNELVTYARMLKSISHPDAKAIFNDAISVASELDTEIMTQICLLDKLSAHGRAAFIAPRQTARKIADVIADAALRLDGYENFPWDEAISSLTHIDLPIALASAAQWADTGLAGLSTTLPPLLSTAIDHGSVTLGQAAALALLYPHNAELLRKIAGIAAAQNALPILAEVCHEMLIYHERGNHASILQAIAPYRDKVPAVDGLIRQCEFLATIQKEKLAEKEHTAQPKHTPDSPNTDDAHQWDRDTLIDAEKLRSLIDALREKAKAEHSYIDLRAILHSARNAVALRDRIVHLDAIAELDKLRHPWGAAQGMLETIDAWRANPAVKQWCQTKWPQVIVSRMPEFYCKFRSGPDELTPAIALTGQSADEVQHLILRGIEQHVDHFSAEHLFALVRQIGEKLPAKDCAELVDWYADRLASRISAEEGSQTTSDESIPEKTDEALARFIFALMGDFDVRIRWRAAHAARRLARTSEHATLQALMGEYTRQEDTAFRDPTLPFYWNAARLWLVIAWDRIAGERPEIAATVADMLLQIALDDAFPHVLVRAFARDACQKLQVTGHFAIDRAQTVALGHVNVSGLQRQLREGEEHDLTVAQGQRFRFDALDTLRSWYEPWPRIFANVDGKKFIQAVERWIVDAWGYGGDGDSIDEGRRRNRINRNWQISTNDHGSRPTLERLRTHLEWHGMWCAIGELLKTEALLLPRGNGYVRTFGDMMRREKLIQGPAWAADLQTPLPLLRRNWFVDSRPVSEWIEEILETDYQSEIFNQDQANCLVVGTDIGRRNNDRSENIRISSALADSATSPSLLRALQTMRHSWCYKLPDDGEDDSELCEEPYRLLGWLQGSANNGGLDEQDPLQGYASAVSKGPGKRVINACRLIRDTSGRAQWAVDGKAEPMFMFESWQKEADEEHQSFLNQKTSGYRLLANKAQLQAFLIAKKMDLIIKVEINRRGEKRHNRAENDEQGKRNSWQLYLLRANGKLEIATEHLGTWSDHC